MGQVSGQSYELKPDQNRGKCKTHSDEIDSGFFGCIKERLKGKNAVGANIPSLAFMKGPVKVKRDRVQASSFDLLEQIQPQRRDREPLY